MNYYYLDVCHSEALAEVRVAFHTAKMRLNAKKEKVAAATLTEVKADSNAPQVKTHVATFGDNLWIVTADEPAE